MQISDVNESTAILWLEKICEKRFMTILDDDFLNLHLFSGDFEDYLVVDGSLSVTE